MEAVRKPCQGVWNIVRFNWHYYVFALLFLTALFFAGRSVKAPLSDIICMVSIVASGSVVISLLVSAYVYDFSGLYSLSWLNQFEISKDDVLVNIHAGFDETSVLLQHKYISDSNKNHLKVFDFYDPQKHTEISIKRARKAYPPYPGTVHIETAHIPLDTESADVVFNILAAHEIRDEDERVAFFKELNRILKPGGKIIVTEHLRDLPNFLAYTIGFFHFHSKITWLQTFYAADLAVDTTIKITPFITTFILVKHGATS